MEAGQKEAFDHELREALRRREEEGGGDARGRGAKISLGLRLVRSQLPSRQLSQQTIFRSNNL